MRKDVERSRASPFDVTPGELLGLLDPNGAGKTTTIKMLMTLLPPTGGSARALDHDVVGGVRDVRRRIDYVFGGGRVLYERLSGLDDLRYFSELYGVAPRNQKARIGGLLELVGLTGREEERVQGYSRSMRQRLHIARGLFHRPGVLFLDEPSIGIGPVGARELRATISTLSGQGKLTTHYMVEADKPCDRIAVISKGEMIAEGTPAQLKARVSGGRVLEVETYGMPDTSVAALGELPGVATAVAEERGQLQLLGVKFDHGAEVTREVLGELGEVRVGRMSHREPTLEDAYVELVPARVAG